MPRTFTLSAHYRAGVEQVYAAFADRRYWLARLADSGADAATLASMTHEHGGIQVSTSQRIRRDRLPGLVAQFHPGDLEVSRVENWGAVHDGHASATIAGRVTGAPARVTGDVTLTPAGDGRPGGYGGLGLYVGCTMNVTATVHVDIPLVGGKVETFIGGQLSELISAEQRFTSRWIESAGSQIAH